jgi:hypothetical protein
MQTYTLREATLLLGLSRSVIARLVESGFVTPERGPRREYRFSFQDMVLLRTAQGLQAARITPRRIVSSLRRLRERLPEHLPLSGLRIGAVGSEVVVRDGGTPWDADSGQLLFDFELPAGDGPHASATVRTLGPRSRPGVSPQARDRAPPPEAAKGTADIDGDAADTADRWFDRAVQLEASDASAAEAAYRRAIEAAPRHADAYLNLGVLLGELGRHAEAVSLYRQGLAAGIGSALLLFNLAVALEDLDQPAAAATSYEQCLALEPSMADAHFNLARLHDLQGRARQAIRHYSAYRRLKGSGAPRGPRGR